MIEKADQIFVLLAHWLVSFLPAYLQHPAMVLLAVIAIIATFPGLFAITVLLERKGLGRMQNRYGPNRVGPLASSSPSPTASNRSPRKTSSPSAPMPSFTFSRPCCWSLSSSWATPCCPSAAT